MVQCLLTILIMLGSHLQQHLVLPILRQPQIPPQIPPHPLTTHLS